MIRIEHIGINEKENNILSVLECLGNNASISVSELMENVRISSSTVSRIISHLRKKEIVVIGDKISTDVGRKPEVYQLNPKFGYLLHYEFNKHMFVGYLADLTGNVLVKSEEIISNNFSLEQFRDLLVKMRDEMTISTGINNKQIFGAGVSLPGITSDDEPTIERIPNFDSLQRADIRKVASEALKIEVITNNDSRLATIGEVNFEYPNSKAFVFINFTEGYGIGGGIVINGEIYKGNRKAAGEIGDMFFDQSNFFSEYRENMGCLEKFAGLKVMYSRIEDAIERGRAKIINKMLQEPGALLDISMIERAVEANDFDVIEIFYSTIKMWATAIINIYALIDPEVVVIGGSINESNQLLLDKLKHYVSRGLYYEPEIKLSKLGTVAQMYGGVYMLKNHVYNKILPKYIL